MPNDYDATITSLRSVLHLLNDNDRERAISIPSKAGAQRANFALLTGAP